MAISMRVPVPVLAMLLAIDITLAGTGWTNVTAQDTTHATQNQKGRTMKIRINVEDTAITATLDNSETSRDFVSLLPLTMTLEDYVATEKISNLPKRLSTKGRHKASSHQGVT